MLLKCNRNLSVGPQWLRRGPRVDSSGDRLLVRREHLDNNSMVRLFLRLEVLRERNRGAGLPSRLLCQWEERDHPVRITVCFGCHLVS
jgi:hypothetical protein